MASRCVWGAMVKGKDCGGISVTDEGFRMYRREAEEGDGKGGTDAKCWGR